MTIHENYFAYDFDPSENLKKCDLVLNISASPYHYYKQNLRQCLLRGASNLLKAPIVYVNQVGGTEELIFDGSSMVIMPSGDSAVRIIRFEERILYWTFDGAGDKNTYKNAETKSIEKEKNVSTIGKQKTIESIQTSYQCAQEKDAIEDISMALVFGIKDFFEKQRFKKAVVGLSGGIDSALVVTLAKMALGRENVIGITMPSTFSSPDSTKDAFSLANNLGIKIERLSIIDKVETTLRTLKKVFANTPFGVTEENVQARARGELLMAWSNKFNHLLLTTGNKSELAVGYCTLYGDMNGALSIIGDLYKTQVIAMAKWINRSSEVIPHNILDKPPSAELRPGQLDSDSLPEYEVLDRILEKIVERSLDASNVAMQLGLDNGLVREIVNKVHQNEHKRFQSPPILRISPKAFGRGRRYPLVKSINSLV